MQVNRTIGTFHLEKKGLLRKTRSRSKSSDHLGKEFFFAKDPEVVVAGGAVEQLRNDGQAVRVPPLDDCDAAARRFLGFERTTVEKDFEA